MIEKCKGWLSERDVKCMTLFEDMYTISSIISFIAGSLKVRANAHRYQDRAQV